MKLLIISHAYPPTLGGTELFVQAIATRLAAKGHQVTVSTSDNGDPLGMLRPFRRRLPTGLTVEGGVTVKRHRMLRSPAVLLNVLRRALRRTGLPTGPFGLLGQYPYLPSAWRDWCSNEWDVIFTSYLPALTATMPALFRRLGLLQAPLIVHTAAHPRSERFPEARWLGPMIRGADLLLTNTAAELEALRAMRYMATEQPADVLGVGLDAAVIGRGSREAGRQRLGIGGKAPVILYLGRISAEKGAYRVVEAVRVLRYQLPNVHLVLVGSGALQPGNGEVGRARAALGPNLIEIGRVDEGVKEDLIAACDVLALPSTADSFGIVYLEAWAQGVPVVGLDLPEIREVIGDGGLVTPVVDRGQQRLAAALLALLTDRDLSQKCARAGRDRLIGHFTWDRVVARLDDHLRRIVTVPR